MKKQLILAAALVTGIAVTNSLYAISAGRPMTAKIPFEFQAGQAVLPAGEYAVGGTGIDHVLAFRDHKTNKRAMLMHNSVINQARQGTAVLVFRKYADRYFLAEVWDGGGTGAAMRPAKVERELIARGTPFEVAEIRLTAPPRGASAD